jgi:hypothetical protein
MVKVGVEDGTGITGCEPAGEEPGGLQALEPEGLGAWRPLCLGPSSAERQAGRHVQLS